MMKWITPRRAILAGLMLVVLFPCLAVYFSIIQRRANEAYLAEFPLPDGVHKLRLLRIEEGLIEYHWKAPLIEKMRGNLDRLRDIDFTDNGYIPYNGWKPTSFLFRIVDQRGRWSHPIDYGVARFEFVDTHGYRFHDQYPPAEQSGGGAFLIHRTAFPRREKTMRLELQFFGARPPVNEKWYTMEIPNPYYREDFPQWKAEPLPVVRTVHGVTARLLNHGYGLRFYDPVILHQVVSDQRWGGDVLFHRVEDATGNVTGDFFHASLSPFEPVWKVTADIAPAAETIFPPEKLQSFGPFTVPAVGQIQPIWQSVTMGDVKVTLMGICGGGTAHRDGAGRWTGSSTVRSIGSQDRNSMNLSISSRIGSPPKPFLMIETSDSPPRSDPEKRIFARCRSSQAPNAIVIQSFQTGRPMAVALTQGEEPVSEVTVDLMDLKPLRFEFLVEPPAKFREEVLHPKSESRIP